MSARTDRIKWRALGASSRQVITVIVPDEEHYYFDFKEKCQSPSCACNLDTQGAGGQG